MEEKFLPPYSNGVSPSYLLGQPVSQPFPTAMSPAQLGWAPPADAVFCVDEEPGRETKEAMELHGMWNSIVMGVPPNAWLIMEYPNQNGWELGLPPF